MKDDGSNIHVACKMHVNWLANETFTRLVMNKELENIKLEKWWFMHITTNGKTLDASFT